MLYSLASRLSDYGYKVGWVVLLDPFRLIYKVTRNRSLLPYVNIPATISILKSKFRYVLCNRFMNGTYNNKHTLERISILYPHTLKKLTFKRLIASAWETTYWVNFNKTECAKYNIIQNCAHEYLQDYIQGLDVNLVSQTFSFPLKK
jgi:hypothetical protein